MSDEFITVWAGERGHYLCAEGPSLSTAARAAMEGEPEFHGAAVPRSRRGFRAKGFRFRDQVCGLVPVAPARVTLNELATSMEATSQNEIACIGRALLTLLHEGRVLREKTGATTHGTPRWAYWRVP